ncbi:MAG: AAA family ATPase [Candidatus Moraniibacteriota bacterium]
MRLNSITLNNVKSYYPSQKIDFREGVHIFIGHNGGGKTNLFEALQGALNLFIFHQGRIEYNRQRNTPDNMSLAAYVLETISTEQSNVLKNILDKHSLHETEESSLEVEFTLNDSDIKLAELLVGEKEVVLRKLEEQVEKSDDLRRIIHETSEIPDLSQYLSKRAIFKIFPVDRCELQPEPTLSEQQNIEFAKLVRLLRYTRLLYQLSLVVKEIDASPLLVYVSPHRLLTGFQERFLVNLSEVKTDSSSGNEHNQNRDFQSNDIGSIPVRIAFLFSENNTEILNNFKEFLREYLKIEVNITKDDQIPHCESYIIDFKRLNGTNAKLSSGEIEFLNLISKLVLRGIRGGIVIIDEPELHLHTQWQQLILDLIYDLAEKYELQFILSTHSPKMVSLRSLADVYRVSMNYSTGISEVIPANLNRDSEIKDLIRFISTTNSEKAFFAKKVILVEGTSDLIVYTEILKKIKDSGGECEEVEILEAGGKGTLGKFREFLNGWKIENFIIGDFDLLKELKGASNTLIKNPGLKKRLVALNEEIESLISFSSSKLRRILCTSPSKDAQSLVDLIANYGELEKEEFYSRFSGLIEYIREERATEIEHPVLSNELASVLTELAQEESIMILRSGSLEKLFPSLRENKIDNALQLIETLALDDIPDYLQDWFKRILLREI